LESLPLSPSTLDNADVELRISGFEVRSESTRDVFRMDVDEGGSKERERLASGPRRSRVQDEITKFLEREGSRSSEKRCREQNWEAPTPFVGGRGDEGGGNGE
jgi:hypothetical protein